MAKAVLLVILSVICTAYGGGVLPNGDDTKIVKVEEPPKVIENILPAVKLVKDKPLELEKNSKDLDSTDLKPISSFFPSIFQPQSLLNKFKSLEENNADMEAEPRKGVLTIFLIRNRDANPDANAVLDDSAKLQEGDAQFKDNVFNSAKDRFNTLTQLIMKDLFGNKEDDTMRKLPLLGGDSDPDHFFRFNEPAFVEEKNNELKNFIRYVKGDEMPILSDDIGYMRAHHHDDLKKCNFMRFLKLKASIHYRTIVHLVFISGIILTILLITTLMLRLHKRRNALRVYGKHNLDVASIDSALAKQKEAEGQNSPKSRRIFRLGNLRASYEQRMAPSVFLSAPPAYDQINDSDAKTKKESSLIKSFATAYKNRYEQIGEESNKQEEDRKSVSSLPPYEDKTNPKK